METTAKAFVQHWSWAADKGVMNRNTAAGLRAACTQVLGALGDWESRDIRALDVEDTLTRFQNLRKKDFKPAVLETYKRRFRQAVASYLAYLQDPGGWKSRTVERAATQDGRNEVSRDVGAAAVNQHELPQAGFVEYPFPLRKGQIARLILPRDLTTSEVKRLSAFLHTLAFDFEPGRTDGG